MYVGDGDLEGHYWLTSMAVLKVGDQIFQRDVFIMCFRFKLCWSTELKNTIRTFQD